MQTTLRFAPCCLHSFFLLAGIRAGDGYAMITAPNPRIDGEVTDMKTVHHSQQVARRAYGMLVVLGILLCGLTSARAQEPGECTEQVLSAPTQSSVKVRLRGASQWPANPICVWRFSGIRADGITYSWMAVLVGDGIFEDPETHLTTVNVAVVFRYEELFGRQLLGFKQVGVDFFHLYPSQGFTTLVDSNVTTVYTGGRIEKPPALSVQGGIHLDASGKLTSDITFTAVADSDDDGVVDDMDLCPNTPPGNIVNEHGCSIEQLVPCAGPRTGGTGRNHGQYVYSVVRTTKAFLAAGRITVAERRAIVRAAAHSDCGRRRTPIKPFQRVFDSDDK